MKYPRVYEIVKSSMVDNDTFVSIISNDGNRLVSGQWFEKKVFRAYWCEVQNISINYSLNTITLTLRRGDIVPWEDNNHEEGNA